MGIRKGPEAYIYPRSKEKSSFFACIRAVRLLLCSYPARRASLRFLSLCGDLVRLNFDMTSTSASNVSSPAKLAVVSETVVNLDSTRGSPVSSDTVVMLDVDLGRTTMEERITPPDGGYGWFVVAATFLISFILTGFLKSFGSYRVAIFLEFPATTSSEAAWITGLISTLSLLFSPVSGVLVASFGSRPLVLIGGLLCATGTGISYFATSAGFMIGSLGVFMGIGSSLAVTASVVCVGRYFTTRRSKAMALALSGGCFGAMCLPTALKALLHALGLRYAFLVLAGMFLIISLCSVVFGPPEKRFRREMVEVPFSETDVKVVVAVAEEDVSTCARILRSIATRLGLRFLGNGTFLLTATIVFVVGLGNPFVGYLPGQAKALGSEDGPAMMLVAYAAVGDLVIRLTYGFLASRSPFSRTVEWTMALTTSAISAVLIPFCTAYWQLAVISVMAGAGTGLWAILIPLVLSSSHGSENLAGTLTLVRLFQGCATIVFPPVSVALRSQWGIPTVLTFMYSKLSFAAVLSLALLVVVKRRSMSPRALPV